MSASRAKDWHELPANHTAATTNLQIIRSFPRTVSRASRSGATHRPLPGLYPDRAPTSPPSSSRCETGPGAERTSPQRLTLPSGRPINAPPGRAASGRSNGDPGRRFSLSTAGGRATLLVAFCSIIPKEAADVSSASASVLHPLLALPVFRHCYSPTCRRTRDGEKTHIVLFGVPRPLRPGTTPRPSHLNHDPATDDADCEGGPS
jgi:hypothetical protein